MRILDHLRQTIEAQPGFDPETADFDAIASRWTDEQVKDLVTRLSVEMDREKFSRFTALFPDEGPLSRHLYPKHMEFFAAGATYRERCFMAGNRCGKTVAGAYETACHLTGRYPHWWVGKRFRRPIRAWVAGATNETTRDILQLELLGENTSRDNRKVVDGSGIIPREALGDIAWKQGVQGLIDTIEVKHVSGGTSMLGLKSYEQGRKAFEGTAKEVIWLDEEVGFDVYGECLIRTATTRGVLMLTFTPLKGLTDVVMQFDPDPAKVG